MAPRIVVIGGGIAGLSAAEYLITHGCNKVTVLEATDRYYLVVCICV